MGKLSLVPLLNNQKKILIFEGTFSHQEIFKLLLTRYLYIDLAVNKPVFGDLHAKTLLPCYPYPSSISLKYRGHAHLKQSVGIKKMAHPMSCSVNTVVRQHNQMSRSAVWFVTDP